MDTVDCLRSASEGVRFELEPSSVLASGYALCGKVNNEQQLCGKASRQLPALGELLVRAKAAHSELLTVMEKGAKSGLDALPALRRKVEDRHSQSVISHLEKFYRFVNAVDSQLSQLETQCHSASARAAYLGDTCSRHKGFKTAAGSLLLFSGCFALMMAAAAIVSRKNLNKSVADAVQASGKVASLVGDFPPVNTGITGGVAAVLGARATSNATTHSKLASKFDKLAVSLGGLSPAINSLRTRFQKLSRASESVSVFLRVQGVVGGFEESDWNAFGEWMDSYEGFLVGALKFASGTPAS